MMFGSLSVALLMIEVLLVIQGSEPTDGGATFDNEAHPQLRKISIVAFACILQTSRGAVIV